MQLDPAETLAFYVIVILVLFTVMAAVAELTVARAVRKDRDQARAEARAKRMEGVNQSDAWLDTAVDDGWSGSRQWGSGPHGS